MNRGLSKQKQNLGSPTHTIVDFFHVQLQDSTSSTCCPIVLHTFISNENAIMNIFLFHKTALRFTNYVANHLPSLQAKTLAIILYTLEKKLMGLKSLESLAPSLF